MTLTTSATEAATKLNPVQMHLLELFSRTMTERELLEIKELLAQYYARKADEVLDEIWEKRGYTKAGEKNGGFEKTNLTINIIYWNNRILNHIKNSQHFVFEFLGSPEVVLCKQSDLLP